MSRELDAKCKKCRREGEKLFLKGTRCHTVKCAIARRPQPPGMHGFRRSRSTDYGLRLREKQKTKRYYGVHEHKFRRYIAEASRTPGNTGETLMVLLERRLDNAVYLLGFADSRAQARQLVAHGHIMVNGKTVNIASLLLKVGNTIAPRPRPHIETLIRERLEARKGDSPPPWLNLDAKKMSGTVVQMPAREDVGLPINDAYIIEFCSR
ncbi:MAG: 30S ribosomal protein S4 [Planctomycetota bacterium]